MRLQRFASRIGTLFFATFKRAAVTVVIAIILLFALCAGWFYRYIATGGLTARQNAPAFETAIARRLINLSIPESARSSKNPLGAVPLAADLAIGRDLYQQNCQMCHGYDGHSTTATGGGLYPKPSNLHDASVTRQPDGAIFYIIRNGIRNTGMPAFSLADQQTWQIVSLRPQSAHHRPAGVRRTSFDIARVGPLRRLCIVCGVPQRHLPAMENNFDGQRRPRSSRASRRDHPRSLAGQPARQILYRRHFLRLWPALEATILQENRRRLLPAAGAMGCHPQTMEAVFRKGRLVGPVLSTRQFPASHQYNVRRLSLRQLQHRQPHGH